MAAETATIECHTLRHDSAVHYETTIDVATNVKHVIMKPFSLDMLCKLSFSLLGNTVEHRYTNTSVRNLFVLSIFSVKMYLVPESILYGFSLGASPYLGGTPHFYQVYGFCLGEPP